MKEMCKIINPTVCPNCGNNLLFFTIRGTNKLVDYKRLIDEQKTLYEIRTSPILSNVEYLKCIGCGKTYLIDNSNGCYPQPLLEKSILKDFGIKY